MRALGTLAAAATAATLGIGLSAAPAGAIVPLPEILPGITPELDGGDLGLEGVEVTGSLDGFTEATEQTLGGVSDASRQMTDEVPSTDVVGEATGELQGEAPLDGVAGLDGLVGDDPVGELGSDSLGDLPTEDPVGELSALVAELLGAGVL